MNQNSTYEKPTIEKVGATNEVVLGMGAWGFDLDVSAVMQDLEWLDD